MFEIFFFAIYFLASISGCFKKKQHMFIVCLLEKNGLCFQLLNWETLVKHVLLLLHFSHPVLQTPKGQLQNKLIK